MGSVNLLGLSSNTEHPLPWASQEALVVKIPPANAGDIRDVGSIPGLERPSGEGHGNPPQYSCLENPMDRRGWRATVHGVAKSRTRLRNRACTHTSSPIHIPSHFPAQFPKPLFLDAISDNDFDIPSTWVGFLPPL